jgi:uncharacterized repeat protein (TIGR01451 family)
MALSGCSRLLALAMIAGTMSVVGCSSTQLTSGDGDMREGAPITSGAGQRTGTAAKAAPTKAAEPAKPAAAAKPAEPAKPAAAAAPAASPRMTSATMYFPTGDRASSGLMVEERLPAQVRLNQPYTYDIIVTNLTKGTLENVTVNSLSTENMKIQSANPAGTTAPNGQMVWNLGSFGPNESKVIKVTAVAEKVGVTGNCINAAYNNSLCVATQVVNPALAITKAITPTAVLNCDPITMTIEVTNTGTGTADNVVVKDTLPAGLTTSDGKTTIEQAVGNLAAGEKKNLSFNLKAAKTGTYQNTASTMADGIAAINSNTVSTKVTQPVLAIECKAGGQTLIGRENTFELTVRNSGDSACKDTKITAAVPAGTAVGRASDGGNAAGGSLTWNVGEIPAGGSKTVSFTLRQTTAGAAQITATASCTCATPVQTTCSATYIGVPDIGTLITDDDGVVLVGDNHVYRLEVKNQGQVNLTNTKMTVKLPDGLTFVSAAGQAATVAGQTITFDIGTVGVGQTKAFTMTCKASKSGELLVVGDTTCTEIKTSIRDDELTVFIDR